MQNSSMFVIFCCRFGSFFGPSKPVISQRVIEERKSLKELHSTIARDPRPSGVCDTTSNSDYRWAKI